MNGVIKTALYWYDEHIDKVNMPMLLNGIADGVLQNIMKICVVFLYLSIKLRPTLSDSFKSETFVLILKQ